MREMRHIKPMNEASIQYKKLSELGGNWSGQNTGKGMIGDINLELGQKVLAFLYDNNLTIEVDQARGYSPITPLGNENKLIEYRCSVQTRISDMEEVEENYKYENDIEDDADLTDDQRTEMMKHYDNSFTDVEGNLAYSVFLNANFPPERLNEAGAAEGLIYLRMFSSCFTENVRTGQYDENALGNEVDGFKSYLKYCKLRITNANVEMVTDINYRIYKDGKFFMIANDEISDYESIITELLKIK